jgi:hypothetical protein
MQIVGLSSDFSAHPTHWKLVDLIAWARLAVSLVTRVKPSMKMVRTFLAK